MRMSPRAFSANCRAVRVPEGQNERSLAIYCQEYSEEPARPARDGMIPSVDRVVPFASGKLIRVTDQIVPTGRVRFWRFPGSKLPGYDHSVPTGHGLASEARSTSSRRPIGYRLLTIGYERSAKPSAPLASPLLRRWAWVGWNRENRGHAAA